MTSFHPLLLLLATLGLFTSCTNVYFVHPGGSDTNDGDSWGAAFQTVQKAIDEAAPGEQIWVAAGTYKPTVGDARNKTFTINKDVKIYGGFNGTEGQVHNRNWVNNPTILSGDIGTVGDDTDNCYHVVRITHRSSAMRLDGFMIEKGNANGSSATNADSGGGLLNDGSNSATGSNPTIANCTFSQNTGSFGGGIFNKGLNGKSSPSLTNCTFSGNAALTDGGGIYNEGVNGESNPVLRECAFSGNSAGGSGAGMYNLASSGGTSSPTLTNCFFSGNAATSDGGGICNYGNGGTSSPSLTHCSFSGNAATGSGGGIFNFGGAGGTGSPSLVNCILWGNSSEMVSSGNASPNIQFSIVQGGCPAGATCSNLLTVNPLFVAQPPVGLGMSGDLHLQDASPAIDAGTASGAPTIDFDRNSRAHGAGFDMGFDERLYSCPGGAILYVNASAAGLKNGSSWANAFSNLQNAFDLAAACPAVQQIWVAAGTYKPAITPDRTLSFVMKNGVEILGGFPATGNPGLPDRNWSANPTILSGDIGALNDSTDNSYHILICQGLDNTAKLNGFTITGGHGGGEQNVGGGMANENAHPTVSNCIFSGNSAHMGGGMFNYYAHPIVTNCHFTGNSAWFFGGGMGNRYSSPIVTNCTFSNNSVSNDTTLSNPFLGLASGGGMGNLVGEPTLTNCTFSGNSAYVGGGVFNLTSSPVLTNCTFSGNLATVGGMLNTFDSHPTVKNCIFWGNGVDISNDMDSYPILNYCIVQGGCPYNATCTNVLDADPFFIEQPPLGLGSDGNLRLQPFSCAINAGNNALIPPGVTTDLDGNPRIFGSTVDLGAYEFQGSKQAFVHPPFTTDNGLHFDGVNDYIRISAGNANTCTPQSFPGGDALTIEYWFKGTNIQSAVRFQADSSNFVVSGWDDNGTFKHILSNDGDTTGGIAIGAAATDGNWHHVAMTWQRNTTNGFKSYLDEQLVEQRNSSDVARPALAQGLYLGSLNGAIEFMSGTLDELRVWSVVRTQAQIQANMCLSMSVPQTGLALFYKFDHGTAGGSNAGSDVLRNSVDGHLFPGFLSNFALSGSTSNWVGSQFTDIRYVMPGGTGCGSSWATASGDLQAMIDAPGMQQIWVAAGTYLPTATHGGSTDRYKTFFINKNVKIYGGFNGTETTLSQRNWTNNVTILSGDLGTVGNSSDNAFHVVWIENRSSAMQLDGFTIEKGNSDQSSSHPTNGGGIYNEGAGSGNSSNPTIANCIIKENYASNRGGGIYNVSAAGTTNPTLTNCTFISNTAGNSGGGLFNNGTGGSTSNPTLTNCSFLGNKANAVSGGAVFNHGFQGNSSPVFTNCVFLGNTAQVDGGAVLNDGGGGTSHANYVNCSFSGNSAGTNAGAMYSIGSNGSPTLTNCILWGNSSEIGNFNANPVVTYSIVQGGHAGTGNLNVNPLFISQPPVGLGTAGNLHLQTTSPAMNAGTASGAPATDFDGDARPQGAGYDMGFDEVCTIAWYADSDNDGFGNPNASVLACLQPADYVSNDDDCNDGNAAIYPGAPEICDGLDNDCNGNPESIVTTWTGLGDGVNWSGGGNWSDGFVPLPCQDVVIPAAGNVTVPAGFTAVGRTLEVAVGAVLTTNPTGQVDIHN